MTTLGKTLFVTLSLAVLIGGTLALRERSEKAPRAQLSPAQLAEIQPPAKPAEPPKAARPHVDEHGADTEAEPQDPELEDGSGS
ncbi:MAG: hypothetical protein AUG04_07955 [Deltaproteobacteria bacterium 13_1_20CM_2_69_21]|nr:MAG: hypothetical protein AUH83_03750 [Deltaproteobacteria bacterium 13_1_40CM_4_68_19]OLD09796.1 MAG: hypothetical protein AUI90_03120 [Deltaproteobacteria bacterium 13_1_40CM_3_69_14]OLE62860.1 MAG: hypothetical protein AUG04_07955 [Deltaproteobacteria bacterium 13_1_20CM_2_69_21]